MITCCLHIIYWILSFGIVLLIATLFFLPSFKEKSGLLCDIYSPKYQKDLLFYYLSGDISADAMWGGQWGALGIEKLTSALQILEVFTIWSESGQL